MAKTTKKELKSWFKKGLYPTEEQFHNWMDSYWHKDEKIGAENISQSFADTINSKAEQAAVTAVSSAVTELTRTVENVREDMESQNWKNGEGNGSVQMIENSAYGYHSFAGGEGCEAEGDYSFAFGVNCKTEGGADAAFGNNTKTSAWHEFACGSYNKTGDEQNRLAFSIGNGRAGTGVAPDVRRNAVEVAQDDSMRVAGIGGFDGTNGAQSMSLQERVNGSPMVHLLCAVSDNGDLGVPANKYTFLWDGTDIVKVLAQHDFPMQWREDIGMGYLVMPATGILAVDYQICDAYNSQEADSYIYVLKASAGATEAPVSPLCRVAHFKGADYSGHFAIPVSEGEAVQVAIRNSTARDLSGDSNLITWTLYEW